MLPTTNPKPKIPCSVGVLTFNCEKGLRDCLESVRDFDEIIVCDGGSTDGTLAMAREYGCKIIEQSSEFKREDNTIANFSGVRNQMLDAAKYDWFLYVDSDEYLGREVVEEMEEIIQKNEVGVYRMPRKHVVEGEVIECSLNYPNIQTRFFHKDAVTSFIKEVHERIEPKSGYETKLLKHPQYVPLVIDLEAIRDKHDYYIAIEVKRYADARLKDFLRWIVWGQVKALLARTIRFFPRVLFCRGKKFPFRYELLWYRYDILLLTRITKGWLRQRNNNGKKTH